MIFLASLRLDRLLDLLPPPSDDFAVCFIPTAAVAEGQGPWSWVEEDRSFFADAGYRVRDLEFSTLTSDAVDDTLAQCQHVHVAGGNTFYLLQEMQRVNFGGRLQEFLGRGGSYSGASAGAVVMGPDIAWTAPVEKRESAPSLVGTAGLGLVPFDPLVHWDGYLADHQGSIFSQLEHQGRIPIPLTDDEAIVIDAAYSRVVHVSGETRPLPTSSHR